MGLPKRAGQNEKKKAIRGETSACTQFYGGESARQQLRTIESTGSASCMPKVNKKKQKNAHLCCSRDFVCACPPPSMSWGKWNLGNILEGVESLTDRYAHACTASDTSIEQHMSPFPMQPRTTSKTQSQWQDTGMVTTVDALGKTQLFVFKIYEC